MNGETLYAASDYCRPFPAPGDVFSREVVQHAEYLLPVATLDLNYLSPDWSGSAHFILPIEPVGGYGGLGEQSRLYHNFLCRPDWLAYKLDGEKCELACDFRYFHKLYYDEHPPEGVYQDELAAIPDHYDSVRSRFATAAEHFQKYGWLHAHPDKWSASQPDPKPNDFIRAPLVRDLGGVSFESNWSSLDNFPVSRYPDKYEDQGTTYNCDRVLPRTEDGRDFSYIGEVEMWNYFGYTNGVLVLFYDPQQHILLSTIDWL